ncbi:Cof-type HAD-IIB family hydrolase [Alicyclobacillus fastidiosus]|uniref:Cof-type HAD-IIB family hydrolase n=1 Tax=Alicyclobacillus fastidiosus TaxID=392011 RepID=A0ABY6ZEB6_9BACL|nr:Cof-type HAD-IIB family hydrolase [Alicyclobacillus fastidiosus]WAH41239.1 Cof-type HAD-IIB family hydrolase [Alicyclobacillus fastidiosus]GMA62831.1 phosphatase [Alicyclobacillus fastidiosus]
MKAVFFDIDGTLISPDTDVIAKSVKEAVVELQTNGVIPILVSGRPPFAIEPVAKELSIQTYIAFNGGLAADQGKVVYHRPIDRRTVDEFVELARQKDHAIVFPGLNGYFTPDKNKATWGVIVELFKRMTPVVAHDYWKEYDVYQMELICDPDQVRHYQDKFYQDLRFYPWHIYKNATNVNPVSNSKAAAMAKILDHLAIPLADSVAIGDGPNDVEMIQTAKLGIAMGNGCDSLKRAADYVTESVWNDGVVQALRHFNLLTK